MPFGAAQVRPTPTLEILAAEITGALGTVRGITVRETFESVLPELLYAATLNTYDEAFVKPVTVVGEVSGVPGVHSVQSAAASSLKNTL